MNPDALVETVALLEAQVASGDWAQALAILRTLGPAKRDPALAVEIGQLLYYGGFRRQAAEWLDAAYGASLRQPDLGVRLRADLSWLRANLAWQAANFDLARKRFDECAKFTEPGEAAKHLAELSAIVVDLRPTPTSRHDAAARVMRVLKANPVSIRIRFASAYLLQVTIGDPSPLQALSKEPGSGPGTIAYTEEATRLLRSEPPDSTVLRGWPERDYIVAAQMASAFVEAVDRALDLDRHWAGDYDALPPRKAVA